MPQPDGVRSLCLFCGSSDAADPDFLTAAAAFGRLLAEADVRLVYGGGGIGLMGAAAKAAHAAGGRVLGVMPNFLRRREVLYDEVETVVVQNMHQRKTLMYEEADAYVVMPGGVGTLEEIVELLSWRRLELHSKPIVFVNLKGFWDPFYALIAHTVEQRFTPDWVPTVWRSVDRVDDILPALKSWPKAA
jgi:uncharacterized protein (TIGR00730 family)